MTGMANGQGHFLEERFRSEFFGFQSSLASFIRCHLLVLLDLGRVHRIAAGKGAWRLLSAC